MRLLDFNNSLSVRYITEAALRHAKPHRQFSGSRIHVTRNVRLAGTLRIQVLQVIVYMNIIANHNNNNYYY